MIWNGLLLVFFERGVISEDSQLRGEPNGYLLPLEIAEVLGMVKVAPLKTYPGKKGNE